MRRSDQGVAHGEGVQDALPHEILVRLTGNRRSDNLACQYQRKIGVLPAGLRSVGGLLPWQRLPDLLAGGEAGVRPVGKRSFTRQSRGVGQQVADGDRRCIRIALPDVEPGQVPVDGVVELQRPSVAQDQDGGAREQLGDGRDPVPGAGGRRDPAFQIGVTEASCPHQILVVDDRDGEPRLGAVRHLGLDPGAQQLDVGGDVGVRRSVHGPTDRPPDEVRLPSRDCWSV